MKDSTRMGIAAILFFAISKKSTNNIPDGNTGGSGDIPEGYDGTITDNTNTSGGYLEGTIPYDNGTLSGDTIPFNNNNTGDVKGDTVVTTGGVNFPTRISSKQYGAQTKSSLKLLNRSAFGH